jgi:hypothetical protein
LESKDPVDVSLYNRGSVKEKKLRLSLGFSGCRLSHEHIVINKLLMGDGMLLIVNTQDFILFSTTVILMALPGRSSIKMKMKVERGSLCLTPLEGEKVEGE